MSKSILEQAIDTMPKELFNKLQAQSKLPLTPGEIFGAAALWKIVGPMLEAAREEIEVRDAAEIHQEWIEL